MPDRIRKLNVNGRDVRIDSPADRPLLFVLREDLDLTGSKYGCGEGQCGACTVLVDKLAVRSCTTPVGSVASKRITTIEGLEREGKLHPVQQAFLDAGAFQCGFCTPGMIMSAAGLLLRNANPSEPDVRQALNGNICRCGAYPRIVSAVRQAASMKSGDSSGD